MVGWSKINFLRCASGTHAMHQWINEGAKQGSFLFIFLRKFKNIVINNFFFKLDSRCMIFIPLFSNLCYDQEDCFIGNQAFIVNSPPGRLGMVLSFSLQQKVTCCVGWSLASRKAPLKGKGSICKQVSARQGRNQRRKHGEKVGISGEIRPQSCFEVQYRWPNRCLHIYWLHLLLF